MAYGSTVRVADGVDANGDLNWVTYEGVKDIKLEGDHLYLRDYANQVVMACAPGRWLRAERLAEKS